MSSEDEFPTSCYFKPPFCLRLPHSSLSLSFVSSSSSSSSSIFLSSSLLSRYFLIFSVCFSLQLSTTFCRMVVFFFLFHSIAHATSSGSTSCVHLKQPTHLIHAHDSSFGVYISDWSVVPPADGYSSHWAQHQPCLSHDPGSGTRLAERFLPSCLLFITSSKHLSLLPGVFKVHL